jgi:flagellar motor switch protein FliN/FliY
MPDDAVQPDTAAEEAGPPAVPANAIDQTELDALTKEVFGANAPTASEPAADEPETVPVAEAAPFAEPELDAGDAPAIATIDLLNDVRLEMRIELGRSNMYLEDVLKLGVGSVVELDKLAGDPVDVYVSDRLIARGEVLVLNDNFCVRINNIHSPIPELEAN